MASGEEGVRWLKHERRALAGRNVHGVAVDDLLRAAGDDADLTAGRVVHNVHGAVVMRPNLPYGAGDNPTTVTVDERVARRYLGETER